MIERDLIAHPASHAEFTVAERLLNEAETQRAEQRSPLLDLLADAWLRYCGILALEMYLAGARDGARIYHELLDGEMPQASEEGVTNEADCT